MAYKVIEGGSITSPKGYLAGACYVGVKSRKSEKPDVAILYSQEPASCAALFTTNKFCAAPVLLGREVLKKGKARAVVINSGNANAATGEQGLANAKKVEVLAEELLGLGEDEVFVSSTGVIGQQLPVEKVLEGVRLSGGTIRIGAMCKGSGMIHPNMATTLIYVATDAKVESAVLQPMLKAAADKSFHMLTVDGDTSTNDSLFLFANGASGVAIESEADKAAFAALLDDICIDMARRIASDGEGATHLMIVEAKGLPTEQDARIVARSIAGSTLFKAALFGKDANWGRIMAAAGYSGADVDPTKADCILKSAAGEVVVMEAGFGTAFSEDLAKQVLTEHDVTIIVDFHSGSGQATAFGCDLTYDYVKINGDYRS